MCRLYPEAPTPGTHFALCVQAVGCSESASTFPCCLRLSSHPSGQHKHQRREPDFSFIDMETGQSSLRVSRLGLSNEHTQDKLGSKGRNSSGELTS